LPKMICKNRILLLLIIVLAISPRAGLTLGNQDERSGNSSVIAGENTLPSFHNGDIILRKGSNLVSDLIAGNFQDCEDMSHCGIILVDPSGSFVVHTISGAISAQDGIRKEPIDSFIQNADNHKVIVLRSNSITDAALIRSECERLLRQKIGFDHEFDADDHSTVYCSELVRDVYQATGMPDFFHYTSRYGIRFIDFDTFFDTRLFTRIYQTY